MKNIHPSFFLIIALGVFLALGSSSCKHDAYHPFIPVDTTDTGGGHPVDTSGGGKDTTHTSPAHPCSPDTVYFENDILPLLASNCAMSGCHDASSHKEGIVLTSYSTITAGSNISVSNPASSKLYRSMKAGSDDQMPPLPRAKMTNEQLALFLKWIQQGAQNNFCDGECDTANITYSASIQPILKTSCIGCHSGSQPSGNISLSTYNDVSVQVQNGKLLGSVTATPGFVAMPQAGKLSACDINAIKIWIQHGAPNN
jgi:cytochrome c5